MKQDQEPVVRAGLQNPELLGWVRDTLADGGPIGLKAVADRLGEAHPHLVRGDVLREIVAVVKIYDGLTERPGQRGYMTLLEIHDERMMGRRRSAESISLDPPIPLDVPVRDLIVEAIRDGWKFDELGKAPTPGVRIWHLWLPDLTEPSRILRGVRMDLGYWKAAERYRLLKAERTDIEAIAEMGREGCRPTVSHYILKTWLLPP